MTNHLVVTAQSKIINSKCEDDYFSKLPLIGKFRTQRPHAWLESLGNHFMAIINVYCLRYKSHLSLFSLGLVQGDPQSWQEFVGGLRERVLERVITSAH